MRLFFAFIFLAAALNAQPVKPQFEVASIKPSPPVPPRTPLGIAIPRVKGGPGTSEPGHVLLQNHTLGLLILEAYHLQPTQVRGPDWLNMRAAGEGIYDVEAKLPPGATREQYRLMLQSLLEERFGLKAHPETVPADVYWLTVDKGGSRLKPLPPAPPFPDGSVDVRSSGSDGFPVTPDGYSGLFVTVQPATVRIKFIRYSMQEFTEWVYGQLRKPVEDHTGLTSVYTFYVEHSRDPRTILNSAQASEPAPELKDALPPQLGLRLVPQKGAVEMLVIDQANRIPTGN